MKPEEKVAELRAAFFAAHPKAIDFPEADADAASEVAPEYGYRLAGKRLGRVVFTTKPGPTSH